MRVLITDPVDDKLIEILSREGYNVAYRPDIKPDELIEEVGDKNVLVVRSRTKVTKDVIDAARDLKLIARVGVGLDNIDVKYAEERGVLVINAGEATAQSVAELTIGLMVNIARRIHYGYTKMLRGEWVKKEAKGIELGGKTLGIIGVGNIGSRVGRIAHYGFGMRVLGYRRRLNLVKEPIIPTPLDKLLEESDIISIHVPLTAETRGFIDKEKIVRMKKGVLIVNTSRMEVLDLDAVIDAIERGHIGGLAADTNIKPSDDRIARLLEFPNVVLTPHIGAQTPEAQERAAVFIAEKIVKILSGRAKPG